MNAQDFYVLTINNIHNRYYDVNSSITLDIGWKF